MRKQVNKKNTHKQILILGIIFLFIIGSGAPNLCGQELAEPGPAECGCSTPERPLQGDDAIGRSPVDIDALQEQAEREGWTFTVSENAATQFSLDQLCGAIEPISILEETPGDPIVPSRGLPDQFDWRDTDDVPPIRNQGSCGSCWAFSAIASMESALLIKDDISEDLSEQWLVSCTDAGSCSGGWPSEALEYLRCGGDTDPYGDSGAVLEADFPYVAYNAPCNGPYDHPYCIESWGMVNGWTVPSVDQLKQAIYDYGPISVCVYANTAFHYYSGGVFNSCRDQSINHAVTLVGWDDNQGSNGVWIMRNSWGTGWGENGYMRIEYECSRIGYAACYVDYSGDGKIRFKGNNWDDEPHNIEMYLEGEHKETATSVAPFGGLYNSVATYLVEPHQWYDVKIRWYCDEHHEWHEATDSVYVNPFSEYGETNAWLDVYSCEEATHTVVPYAYNNGPAQQVVLLVDYGAIPFEAIFADAPEYGTVEIPVEVPVGYHTFEIFGFGEGSFGYDIAEGIECTHDGQLIDVGTLSQTEYWIIPMFINDGSAQLVDLYIDGEGPLQTKEAHGLGPWCQGFESIILEEGVHTFEVIGHSFGNASADRAVEYDMQQIYIGELNEWSEIDIQVDNWGPQQMVHLYVDGSPTPVASHEIPAYGYDYFQLDLAPGYHDFLIEGELFGSLSADDEYCPAGSHYMFMGYLEPTEDLMARWQLDEGEGPTTQDVSDFTNDGVLHDTTWTTGIVDNALEFDGDDYIEIPDDPSLDITDELTIELWIYQETESTAGGCGITKEGTYKFGPCSTPGYVFRMATTGGDWADQYLHSSAPTILHKWVHITATYNSATSTARIYINGELDTESTTAITGYIIPNENPVWIGRGAAPFLTGRIDEVKIFNQVLTEEEIQTHYHEECSYFVDPLQSTLTLTPGGLTTCPAGHLPDFGYTPVNVNIIATNVLGDPIQGIPAESFTFTLTQLGNTHYFGSLSCIFTPLTTETDATGQIQFKIIGDTSIAGDIMISVAIAGFPVNEIGILPCNSFDYYISELVPMDGLVGLQDFGTFASDWNTAAQQSDFNWDGIVNLIDFGMFANHWNHQS